MRRGVNVAQLAAAQRKRTLVTAGLIFILFPLLIALGVVLLRDRSYMLISWIILALTIAPFFMDFEKRRPKARELVLIAVCCALTIVAELFFGHLVGVRVGTGLIIVFGVALGPEPGFLIGSLSRFVLNFYAGQGPWTPWQMVCWGLLGFLAGLCFNRAGVEKTNSRSFKLILGPVLSVAFAVLAAWLVYLFFHEEGESFFGWRLYVFGAVGLLAGVLVQRKRLPVDDVTLTAFTFFVTFIVYGGLMNVCAMVTALGLPGAGDLSWTTLRGLYLTGVPYDAVHAATAAVFNFFFGDKVIRKLERVKLKYGIYR